MTAPEYMQLKAYARQDGFFLALLWTASFACYILGISNQMLGMLAIGLAVMTPFFVAGRLRKFRDEGREGLISFGRSSDIWLARLRAGDTDSNRRGRAREPHR